MRLLVIIGLSVLAIFVAGWILYISMFTITGERRERTSWFSASDLVGGNIEFLLFFALVWGVFYFASRSRGKFIIAFIGCILALILTIRFWHSSA
ncbi:MAG: hypothetical protein JWM04_1230 [Verrucomicrobiales bacterium]|jgi:uncharacterized membrane protein|nr:hypothetical protein [Verrucomicrobiales bacterium]